MFNEACRSSGQTITTSKTPFLASFIIRSYSGLLHGRGALLEHGGDLEAPRSGELLDLGPLVGRLPRRGRNPHFEDEGGDHKRCNDCGHDRDLACRVDVTYRSIVDVAVEV